VNPATLNQLFFGAVERYAGRPAVLRQKVNGAWQDLSFETLVSRVHAVSVGLQSLSLAPGDRVALISENRPEWAIVDYACLTARLTDVPIYPTLTPSQTAYILRDAGAKVVIVSSQAHLEKILSVRHETPALEQIVLFDGSSDAPGVSTLASVEARGRELAGSRDDWQHDASEVTPDDLATLIYTSGTTGEPKGVMLSHGNITSNVVAALEVFDIGPGDSCLSFLPLCHMFERMVGHYSMLQGGAVINYASSIDAMAQELQEVHPTILASVPRIYEKVHAAILAKGASGGPLSRAIFNWSRDVGDERLTARLSGRTASLGNQLAFPMADALVFRKVRQRLGGSIRFMISGSAPLNIDICRFFLAAGLTLYEGYGLTETSPVITANSSLMLKPGTVGRPLPGIEVRIAADGEILTRGPNVMKGYYHKPEATAEAIDRDGWFSTGDIGTIDDDGCLRITDRKKDLIKTAGGKYVAPQPIEAMLQANRYFANAVLLGDRRPFPIMLLVPNMPVLTKWLAQEGIPAVDAGQLLANPRVRDKLEREARKSLRDVAQFETPKKFLLLPHDFTIESGELTPTLKVKRKVVEANYAAQIEALYAGS
jgi:long-chain acyl-CoA synthetase